MCVVLYISSGGGVLGDKDVGGTKGEYILWPSITCNSMDQAKLQLINRSWIDWFFYTKNTERLYKILSKTGLAVCPQPR